MRVPMHSMMVVMVVVVMVVVMAGHGVFHLVAGFRYQRGTEQSMLAAAIVGPDSALLAFASTLSYAVRRVNSWSIPLCETHPFLCAPSLPVRQRVTFSALKVPSSSVTVCAGDRRRGLVWLFRRVHQGRVARGRGGALGRAVPRLCRAGVALCVAAVYAVAARAVAARTLDLVRARHSLRRK